MKTRKLRLVSALLAVAMMLALLPTAAFAEDSTKIKYDCGENGNNIIATLDTVTGVMTISGTGAMKDYNIINPDQPWLSQRDSIKHLVVENGVTSIGKNAFANCLSLETVELPQNGVLETIKYNAFSWSYSSSEVGAGITEITIPKSVKTIEAYAFDGCTKLATVIFAKGSQLNVVEYDAFRDCSDVTIYYSDENVKTRLSGIVDADRIKLLTPTVTFVSNGGSNVEPATVKNGNTISAPDAPTREGWNFVDWYTKNADGKWADKAFNFDTPITDNMTLYARWTASGTCGDNLTWTLDDSDTLTISGSGAMADYGKADNSSVYKYPPWDDHRDKITKLVVENGVITIGNNAFSDCTALKDVDLSKASSLETIGNHAFSSCTALKSVDLSEASSLTTIKTSFPGCTGLENVVLNEGLVEIGGSAFNTCTSLGSIHIPSTVTAIGGYCFERCTSLSEVTFAAGSQLTTIAEATFAGCKILETITIPKKVKEIQTDAFNGCGGLKSVTFEPGSELETIGDVAFQDTAISEISIPASVKTIGSYVFRCVLDEKLTKVIFESPSSLEKVDRFTFVGCSKATIYGDDNVMSKLSGIVAADKIKPANLTVTFISNGGSDVKPATVKNENTISAPDAPTREGWNFAGWYTKKDGNWAEKPFDFINTPITDNMILYARWATALVPITPAVELYPITIDYGAAYDAEGNPIEKAAAGDVVTIKADETALEGMAFERWEVRKGEVKLENDRAAETSFTMPAGEVQLEAMYQAADANDSGWDAATVVTGAVIGTGTAILAYHIGMEVYAEQVLGKDVAVPRTRGEVALLAWQLAGSPAVNGEGESLSEAAQAERWVVESGLMQNDAQGNFNGTKKMSKWNALRTLDSAKKLG